MESLVLVPSNPLVAATQIIDAAEEKGVRLRLLGGLAFKKLCPSSSDPRYFRENKDIDLMGKREDTRDIVKIMETLGYRPREVFNKLNMGQRLIYYDVGNKRRVDLFLDEIRTEFTHAGVRTAAEAATITARHPGAWRVASNTAT